MQQYNLTRLICLLSASLAIGGGPTLGVAGQAAVPGCREQAAPAAAPHPVAPMASGQASFALNLLTRLAADKAANVSMAPFGVTAVLAELELGADTAMRAAIAKTVGLTGRDPGPEFRKLRAAMRLLSAIGNQQGAPFSSADALFVDRAITLKAGVAERLVAGGGLTVTPVDFSKAEAIEAVNAWASQRTHGRITSILEPGGSPALVAVNAFTFRDCWGLPFDPTATVAAPFTMPDGTKVERAMMRLTAKPLSYRARGRFVAIELPYADDRFVMTLVTTKDEPAAPSAFADVQDLLLGREFKTVKADLALPKFVMEESHDLLSLLNKLGLEAGLASPTQLSGLADGLRLTALRQKIFIEVDESGTEAASVTAAEVSRALETTDVRLSFDRPFVYALRHKETGMILMIGYVGDPAPAR